MDILCSRTARVVARLVRFYDEHAAGLAFTDYEATKTQAAAAHQQYRFLRKYEHAVNAPGVESDPVKRKRQLEDEALRDFLANEKRLSEVDVSRLGRCDIGTVLMLAKARIRELLGEFSPKEFSASVGLTSGASTSRSRRYAHPVLKLKGRMHVTRNCALLASHFLWDNAYMRSCMQQRYGYGSVPSDWFDVVDGSAQFSVAKQWDKLRLAAKEPDLNLILQKGIGEMIRRRLKRVGINLDDSSRNRELARIGSRTGALATVDLSNASNNILLWFVREMLPSDWYMYVHTTRSPEMVLLNGDVHTLQMVSTMGNGFTFELESLLFWGLCKGVQEYLSISDRRLAVFGDDIVIHATCVPLLAEVFASVGMQVNMEKTYQTGPYRESCGGYYFLGHDIKGHYLRKEIRTLGDACKITNDLLAFCSRADIVPPWNFLQWLFKGEFNRIPPVVPANYDERSGVRWWPTLGVRYCFRRQAYRFTRLHRLQDKVVQSMYCRWSLAARYLLGNLPGVIDPGINSLSVHGSIPYRKQDVLVFAEVTEVEVYRGSQDSSWEVPDYPVGWVPDNRLFG